jgi:hypothetical protein
VGADPLVGPAVNEDLPVGDVALGEDHERAGHLRNLRYGRIGEDTDGAARFAETNRVVLAELRGALLHERGGPRLIRQAARSLAPCFTNSAAAA